MSDFNSYNAICAIVYYIAFGVLVLLFTMKVQINNKILEYCGKHLFSIYILHRLPIILLLHFGVGKYPYLLMALVFVITFLISAPFDLLLGKIDNLVFNRKNSVPK